MTAGDPITSSLATAYTRGLLVPFLGAGMSAPPAGSSGRRGDGLPLWGGFVAGLEAVAGSSSPGSTELTERAAAAVRRLQHASPDGLAEGVRTALGGEPCRTPAQILPVAGLHWPLVVTTNYDDLYVAAVHGQEGPETTPRSSRGERPAPEVVPLEVLGRSDRDCQEVLASLRRPSRPILWAVQGFVGGQAATPAGLAGGQTGAATYSDAVASDARYVRQVRRLEEELVVGHAEYRRVALRSDHFRRTFAEVWRSRSLLFLGTSLTDRYLLDLFSEIVELYGPSPLPHFALMKAGTVNARFLRQSYGIWVDEFGDFPELPDRLAALAADLSARTARDPVRWSREPAADSGEHRPRIAVVASDLLSFEPRADECILFSGGGGGKGFKVSHVAEEWLGAHDEPFGRRAWDRVDVTDLADHPVPLWRHAQMPNVFAVVARLDPWTKAGWRTRPLDPQYMGQRPTANAATMRDVRVVEPAIRQSLDAARREFRGLHSMLLAAGSRRTFPQSSALLQMVRGWARHRQAAGDALPLTIHLHPSSSEVLVDLRSGRLDLDRALDPEWLDFWVEVDLPGRSYARYLCLEAARTALFGVAAQFDTSGPGWAIDVRPSPGAGFDNWTTAAVETWQETYGERMTLESIGVLPGSILRFTRIPT